MDADLSTAEDRNRTEYYRQEATRNDFREKTLDFAQFIAGLELKINIRPAALGDVPRMSQLSIRTNQFNVSTVRRNENEMKRLLDDPATACFVVDVRDRFGDYGLAGLCVSRIEPSDLVLDSFMLSCRAIGRGVEHRMLSFLGKFAEEKDLSAVAVRYVPTARNKPALAFLLETCGSCKRPQGQDLVFEVPSAHAAGVVFEPREMPAKLTKDIENPVAEPGGNHVPDVRENNESLVFIAHHLNDTDAVSKAVQGFAAASRQAAEGPAKGAALPAHLSPSQETLYAVWQDVLSVKSIDIQKNFFDAGGTSLQMPAVAVQIKQRLGIEVALIDLFQHTTIAQLAAFLDERNAEAKGNDEAITAARKQRASMDAQRKRFAAARKKTGQV
jgi:acyl carrier protein